MIRPSIIVIEFSALADSGQMQRYLRTDSRKLLKPSDMLKMFRIYASDAVLVAHVFPFRDAGAENIPQMLPCPN